MTFRIAILSGLIFFLSCGQETAKKETIATTSTVKTDTITNTSWPDSTAKISTQETISPYQAELNKALADPTIDDYYKEIYNQEKLILTDDNKMLTITENLLTNDPNKDLFYFIVFTKSMNGSDGFYSEAVGLSALNFVTNKTAWFADYFNIAPKLTDKDLDNWAQYVYGEIQISNENNEVKAVKELEKKLYENIKLDRKEYQVIIERLIKRIERMVHRAR